MEEFITEYRFVKPVCAHLYQMCDCVNVMLPFMLLLGAFGAGEGSLLCEMRGIPEFPLLSKEGDITIGGAFSIHSQISKPPVSFTETPEHLLCSRYFLLHPFSFGGFYTEEKSFKF